MKRLDTTALAVSDSSLIKSAERKMPASITVSFKSIKPVSFPVRNGLVKTIENIMMPENITKTKICPA